MVSLLISLPTVSTFYLRLTNQLPLQLQLKPILLSQHLPALLPRPSAISSFQQGLLGVTWKTAQLSVETLGHLK